MMETKIRKKLTLNSIRNHPVDLEFQDLSYTLPQGRKGPKVLLRSISGQFRSGQLSAILGPSGAGKSTLLNVLAGYKANCATGLITTNGEPRNMVEFRKQTRYIMQVEILQPKLTVKESMMIAADLKLNRSLSKEDKLNAVMETLDMLRLTPTINAVTDSLSGGERKRLSIALELISNPPVLFLDEPTSGLDDLASSQCVSLLKMLAEGGRTVICSVHAPSARLFSKFDQTYILASGQCIYQGSGQNIVPFLSSIGLTCPKHYNPADFIIEAASGEYGSDTIDKMINAIDNGRNITYCKKSHIAAETDFHRRRSCDDISTTVYAPTTEPPNKYYTDSSIWNEFKVLLWRFWLQACRDLNYLVLKIILYSLLGFVLGSFYLNMGQDASKKALFNFGYCYTSVIAFLYLPLMPVLLAFPVQIQLIRREHFNQWYSLTSYYLAMSVITLPLYAFLALFYIGISYIMSDQPLEFDRITMYIFICVLIAFVSDSFGLMVSSVFNMVNALFMGPCLVVPMMLIAVYGIGHRTELPVLVQTGMYFSYLRYGMEALIITIYGNNRELLRCPDEEDVCPFRDPKFLIGFMGMGHFNLWIDLLALFGFFLIFRLASFYLLSQRLQPNKTFATLQLVVKIVKSHFNSLH